MTIKKDLKKYSTSELIEIYAFYYGTLSGSMEDWQHLNQQNGQMPLICLISTDIVSDLKYELMLRNDTGILIEKMEREINSKIHNIYLKNNDETLSDKIKFFINDLEK